jgi:hypothetical protein
MIDKPTYAELESRIKDVIGFYHGSLPIEHALVWEGYIGALAEWGLVSVAEHERLLHLLGKLPAAPMLHISLGSEGAHDLMRREGIEDSPIRRKSRARVPKAGHRG